jgi:cysteine desulfurase
MRETYLDHAATTPLDPLVRAEMEPYLSSEFANPSSRHPPGVRAASALDQARTRVAGALGVRPEGVIFTSGGTEANNLAVLGFAREAARRGRHVLVGPSEHPSVRESAQALEQEGFEVEFLRLTSTGSLDLDHAAGRLRPQTVLVAQMLVQNEYGSVYPVRALAKLARARSPHARVFCDAVQGLGKLDLCLAELGADAVSISAHKVHGPKGAGALVCSGALPIRPLVFGGGQERGVRPGTQNVAGIAGFGLAAMLAERERPATAAHLKALRSRLLSGVVALGVGVLEPPGGGAAGSPAIAALLLEGCDAEVCMHDLERRGVFVSAGSACSAAKSGPSPTLAALGFDAERSRRVLRVSMSKLTTPTDVDRLLDVLAISLRDLRAISA